MNAKTKIKNDLWRWNYIIPFVKKYKFDTNKLSLIKQIATAYINIHPIYKKHATRSVGSDTKALLETIDIVISENSRFIYFIDTNKTIAVQGNIVSNFTLPYDKIIHGSFTSLIIAAEGNDEYGLEARMIYEGVAELVNRITDCILHSSFHEPFRTKRLHDFSRMLNTPAEHFDEALQRILFFNQILWQTRHRLNGLGRLDMILDDLYTADISSGYLTKTEASQTVADFLTQLSRYADYKSDALKGDIGQIIILGGKKADGGYFCNELTEIFLEEQSNLGKPDPKTILRVADNTPQPLLDLAVKCLLSMTGSPLFSNDEVVIPALSDFGVPTEEAFQYCTSACWEPLIVGKSMAQNNIAVFDFFPALDYILNQSESKTGSSFEALVNSYIECNKEMFSSFLKNLNEIKWAKDPLVSLFTDGCSEKRKDISEGGAKYCNYGVTTVALSNVVDSLLNLKELVFDSKQYTLSDINRLRNGNFSGDLKLFSQLQINKHYGRDDSDAISLTLKITASLAELIKSYKNPLGGTVKLGLSSPGYNMLSRNTPADLSGRKAGMPYNTHISCMNAGYTEVVNFAGQLNYKDQWFNGNVVDFFTPAHMIGDNTEKFALFLRGAIKVGFFQMQMNLMDSKTLIDAKSHPENYTGLIVRVWGFSAYFNDLPESYKNLLIERALAAEKNS